jgi:2-keto-4-pentenoate hydratase/DNA-binding MarR family transcriptional regulator
MSLDLKRQLIAQLVESSRLLRNYIDHRAKGRGTTRAQWIVLFRLRQQEGLSQVDLADVLELQPISLVRLLDRLVEHGLLERRPDPKDRRANRLFLTRAGRQLVDDLDSLRDTIATDVLWEIPDAAIGTSLETLRGIKERIKALGEHPRDVAVKLGGVKNMLDKNETAAAAKNLHDHWQAGTKIGALDPSQRPRDRAEGYAIQAAMQAYGSPFGWKIAATSEAGQKHINVAGPLAGRIFSERVIPDGGTASMAGNAMAVGEPEFAFRIGRSLPARPTPYSVDEILGAVDTLHPAIELPDSRFADFVKAGEAQLIADNACAHLFVLGAPTAADWRAVDLVAHRPVITLRGQRFVGYGGNVLGDPRVALAWLANELRGLGVTLKAGEVVTTGTCHPPLPIQSGDRFEADFGIFGKVSVALI